MWLLEVAQFVVICEGSPKKLIQLLVFYSHGTKHQKYSKEQDKEGPYSHVAKILLEKTNNKQVTK